MRYISVLLLLLILTTSVKARQMEELLQEEKSLVVIKAPNLESELSTIVQPVLTQVYNNRTLQYRFNDSYKGSPASAFLSSLVIPGLGQVTHKNWIRAGLFMAVEVTGIYLTVSNRNKAIKGERRYEQFIDNNWSVVEYSNWLINYHEVNGINNPYIDNLKSVVDGQKAEFSNQKDWDIIPLSLLRNVERNTPFITTDQQVANNFSHTLPDYGSQQYYELVAKYYQFQGGWRDYQSFHNNIGNTGQFFQERYKVDRTGATASTYFFHAADMANTFNQNYRVSRLFTSILIANHFISAFDSYFTFRLKQKDLQLSSSVAPGRQISLLIRFN